MYVNHDELVEFCEAGFLQDYAPECINAASIDLRLGNKILVEVPPAEDHEHPVIDYGSRNKALRMQEITLDPEHGYEVRPGTFFLAHTVERCNFPDDVAALFRIKSSQGRIGFEHMDAGWVDPGFHGALTLEFVNMTRHHSFRIRPGDRIGQLIVLRGNSVAEDKSYRTTGNYNGATGAVQIRYSQEDNSCG